MEYEDVADVFMDAAFNKFDGESAFALAIFSNESFLGGGTSKGLEVFSSEEAERRGSPLRLK